MNETIYHQLDEEVQRLMREVAETIIVPAYHAQERANILTKPDASIVTKTDLEAQDFLQQKLAVLLPQSNFVGEEDNLENPDYPDAEWTWVVDPIDGTHNFATHNIDFGVIVALWNNKEKKPKYGWIFLPMYNVMLAGGEGVGVYHNGEKLSLHKPVPRKPFREMVGILNYDSFGEAKKQMRFNGQVFLDVVQSSCAALKFAQIIKGEADFAGFGRAKFWDLCAGFALVEAVGGRAAMIDGTGLRLQPPSGKNEWCLAVHDKATWSPVCDQLFRDVKPN